MSEKILGTQFNDGSCTYKAPALLESLVSESLDRIKDTICDEDKETKNSKYDFDNFINQLFPFTHLDLDVIETLIEIKRDSLKNFCI